MVEWRPVVGFEGYYEVSSDGQVRGLDRVVDASHGSKRRQRGGIKKAFPKPPSGHLTLVLRMGNRSHNRYVHRLVLEAFAGIRPTGMEACHRDGNVLNNHISNLYWGSRSDNLNDAVRHGTHGMTRRTECAQGHPYDGENTYTWRGRRMCKQCRHNAGVQRRAERRSAA